jgi:hypothetical protein
MSNNTLKLGDWNAICDRCGRKFKASELKKTWDNLYVCKDDWEKRHPLDLFRGKSDDTSVPWARPEGADAAGTDIEGTATDFIAAYEYVDDADKTLIIGTDSRVQNWNTALTANRTVTLSTTNAITGDEFLVYRTAGGAFTLDVGGLQTIPASVNALVVVKYNGNSWTLESYTTLGL